MRLAAAVRDVAYLICEEHYHRNMAKKTTMKRSRKVKKTASEKRVGTTAGATIREAMIAQSPTTLPGAPSALIQGDRILNLMNRRLYRQHKVYTMKVGLQLPNTSDLPPLKVYALANTWWTRKAMSLAKHIYDEAVEEERAVVGSSRWHDFRIGTSLPLAENVYPVMFDAAQDVYFAITEGTTADGEYQFSNVTTIDQTGASLEKGFQANGKASTSGIYDIFDEYNKMGPDTMNDPVFVATGGYDRATGTSFEDGNVADLLNDGNLPPYNAGDLPFQTPWVQVGEIRSDAGGTSIVSTGFFEAPLGLVYIPDYDRLVLPEVGSPRELCDILTVEFKEGDYKGVEAFDI